MPEICYVQKKFQSESLHVIMQVNSILEEYAAQGFRSVTLRQMYYQFVSRGLFPDDRRWSQPPGSNKWVRDPNGTRNADPNYKWLGGKINDGRLAGWIDWSMMEDRTRVVKYLSSWRNPKAIMDAALHSYHLNRWAEQEYRPEVWIEKDALSGVIDPVCTELDVPYFACKGYTSQSAMWVAAQRLHEYMEDGRKPHIIHLGDHDPSGMDMTEDIMNRLEIFLSHEGWERGYDWTMERIALNMDQIREFNPPSDPAKLSDSRGKKYIKKYGPKSWELDALSPSVMADLIRDAVEDISDFDKVSEVELLEIKHKKSMETAIKGMDFTDDE